jgi:hypothetical protein
MGTLRPGKRSSVGTTRASDPEYAAVFTDLISPNAGLNLKIKVLIRIHLWDQKKAWPLAQQTSG